MIYIFYIGHGHVVHHVQREKKRLRVLELRRDEAQVVGEAGDGEGGQEEEQGRGSAGEGRGGADVLIRAEGGICLVLVDVGVEGLGEIGVD